MYTLTVEVHLFINKRNKFISGMCSANNSTHLHLYIWGPSMHIALGSLPSGITGLEFNY